MKRPITRPEMYMHVFITDQQRRPDWREIIPRMKRHEIVLFRDYDAPNREALATETARVCRKSGVNMQIAGDWRLAWQLNVGLHLPSHLAKRGRLFPIRPNQMLSTAAHNFSDIIRAKRLNIPNVLISPIFATRSHIGKRGLGVTKYHNLARAALELGLNPIALGGLNDASAKRLSIASGQVPSYAAIDGFQPRTSLYFSQGAA